MKYLPECRQWNERIEVFSFSGYRIQDLPAELEEVVPFFNNIWLHLGTNNMPKEKPSEAVAHYEKLLRRVRAVHPTCSIFVASVLPRGPSGFRHEKEDTGWLDLINTKAHVFNSHLQDLAQRYEDVFYVNFWDDFWPRRQRMLSKDGLHLSHRGVTLMIERLKYLTQVAGAVESTTNID